MAKSDVLNFQRKSQIFRSYLLDEKLRNQERHMVSEFRMVLVLSQLFDCKLAQLLVFVQQTDGAERQKPLNWRWRQPNAVEFI